MRVLLLRATALHRLLHLLLLPFRNHLLPFRLHLLRFRLLLLPFRLLLLRRLGLIAPSQVRLSFVIS